MNFTGEICFRVYITRQKKEELFPFHSHLTLCRAGTCFTCFSFYFIECTQQSDWPHGLCNMPWLRISTSQIHTHILYLQTKWEFWFENIDCLIKCGIIQRITASCLYLYHPNESAKSRSATKEKLWTKLSLLLHGSNRYAIWMWTIERLLHYVCVCLCVYI